MSQNTKREIERIKREQSRRSMELLDLMAASMRRRS